jgi:four helix bundle protein
MMNERKNINRGYKKLRVWQDGIELYVISVNVFKGYPFEMEKIISNTLDACHSITRNIAEGYCRRRIHEYLNFLNIALGSCGEFHSSFHSLPTAEQLSDKDFEKLDQLHFKVENQLPKRIESVQRKRKEGIWNDTFT